MQSLINLFNEIGMLAHTPRSGFAFLGTGKQSVAEHSHRMTLIAYALAMMGPQPVDLAKLLLICLFHDLPEARTGDLNYVNKRYVKANEKAVIEDLKDKTLIGPTIAACHNEYVENDSIEAQIAHDADKLELLLVLKELYDTGNPRAMDWFEATAQLVKLERSKSLIDTIRTTPYDQWWRDLLK